MNISESRTPLISGTLCRLAAGAQLAPGGQLQACSQLMGVPSRILRHLHLCIAQTAGGNLHLYALDDAHGVPRESWPQCGKPPDATLEH